MSDQSHQSRIKMELLSLVVIAASLVVVATQNGSKSVLAASLQAGVLNMNGGEQVQVVCNGSRLNITNQSVTQILASCLAAVVTPSPSPSPTTTPTTSVLTVTFDDRAAGNLTGQYPAGVTWDSTSWMVSNAWELFTTRNLSFRNTSTKQGTVSFAVPSIISSIQAYNGGAAATVSIACGSNPRKDVPVPAKTVTTIVTNFTSTCTSATIAATNGWDTNFDTMMIQVPGGAVGGGVGSPTNTPSTPRVPVASATPTPRFSPTSGGVSMGTMSMALMAWSENGKNKPHATYDKCDDGTNIVSAHNAFNVVAYDGLSYPTWHPAVATNPITGVGKCYFGHEHGRNPADYQYYNEIASHFGRDMNGDGQITAMRVSDAGVITANDRAGLPFGMANEKMDQYYNQEGRDSIFVRHEDHVGHKVEYVNGEADMIGHSTHVMGNNTTGGVNIPYGASDNYSPTGVRCAQLHKIHQGVSTPDAIRNNLHELIIHSNCSSTNAAYKSNTIIATGMIPYGRPGEYRRFCAGGNMPDDRYDYICADGGTSPNCTLNDPLIAKLPADRLSSASLGRNMVDRYCLNKVDARGDGTYFNPYEIWEGSLEILRPNGSLIARIGRQWEVLDPVRYADSSKPGGIGYNSLECDGLLAGSTQRCDRGNKPWDSRESGFKGLARSMYIARNTTANSGGPEIVWTDPLGGNATTTSFGSGLKQKVTNVTADFANVPLPAGTTLNDRSIKRDFDDEGNNSTVHAPN